MLKITTLNLNLRKLLISTLVIILSSCQSTSKKSGLLPREPLKQNNVFSEKGDKRKVIINANCLGLCPIKINDHSNILVDYEIITLSMNKKTKFADWVAYRVDKQNMGGESKLRNWAKDPKLSEELTLIPSDYKGLNSAPYNFDRGHQAPLAAFKNHPSWYVVNYLSNITPQKKYLNQGPWNALEAQERKLASSNNKVFVLTGPYYDKNKINAPEPKRINYVVPSGYWKIISIKDKGKVKTISFLFSQSTERSESYCDHQASIEQIKSKTALEFSKLISKAVDESMLNEINCMN